MRKSKSSRRSRLIRKWDGTPLSQGETTTEQQATASENPDPAAEGRKPEHTELVFDFEQEDQLTDTLDR